MTNVSVTAVNSGTISIGASDVIAAAVGIGTTTAAPVVTIKRNDPPDVIFDAPLSYTNIPLIYDSNSTTGAGQSASVDLVVGMGGSVTKFEVKREGFGYGNGEILTVATGGATGIPTTSSATHRDFELTIQSTHTDEFSGWTFGQLEPIDNFSGLFDGDRKVFQMKVNDEAVSLKAAPGWDVDPIQSLLIFVNGLLQEPNYAYNLGSGGSSIVFTTAPKVGDYVHVLFYKGTPGIDVAFLKVAKLIKKGDKIDIQNNPESLTSDGFPQGPGLNQEPRVITGITSFSSDTVSTNPYNGLGITTDISLLRPATWKKQTEDMIINTRQVGKDRVELEADIYPSSYLIQSVGGATTALYVDSARPFFNRYNEQPSSLDTLQNFIDITDQSTKNVAIGTALVSETGTITGVTLSDVGAGYTGAPTITFSPPPEGSGYTTATATCTIDSDKVDVITITSAGTGYTTTNPPVVSIAAPELVRSFKVDVDSYAGDFGNIVGFGTTTTSGKNQVIFDFYIPDGSALRSIGNGGQVSAATTVSGISTGDFFVAYNTNHIISGPEAVNVPTIVELTAGGSGYKTAAGLTSGTRTVATTGGGGGSGLTLDLTIESGAVTAIAINVQGAGYVLNSVGGLSVSPGSGCTFNITGVYGTLETKKADGTTKVGATTSYMDCVYEVASCQTVTVTNTSIGATSLNGPYTGLTTDVRRVFCNIAGIATDNFDSTLITFDSNKTGVGTVTWDTQNAATYTGTIVSMANIGQYSWGKINVARTDSKVYSTYTDNGVVGLTTSGMITRYNPLEMKDYVIT